MKNKKTTGANYMLRYGNSHFDFSAFCHDSHIENGTGE